MGTRILRTLFLVSLLIHLLFLKFYELGTARAKLEEEAKEPYIELSPVEVKDLDPNQAHQIIELPPGPDTEPPAQTKYLANRTLRVEKEMMQRPGEGFAGHSAPPVSSQSLFQADAQKKSPQKAPEILLEDKLKLTPAELFNSSDSSLKVRDFSGSKDFLEGAVMGDVTLANAYKFKYAYFFYQLRDSIRFYWNPEPALHLLPNSTGDLVTKIRFVLNKHGFLQEIEVISSSGFSAIDRAGLNAIQNATPVFSVPEALLDQNQQLPLICEFRILRK